MFCDIVLMKRTKELETFGKELGFDKILFENDLKKLKIVYGGDEKVNRKAVENKNNDMLMNPHLVKGKDKLHYRKSGLNHVLCKLANENNVAIGFSLDKMYDPVDLGRVKQNIKLCRKYKVKIVVVSFAKNKYQMRALNDLMAFCRVIGMDSKQAKEAFSYICKLKSFK